MAKPAAQDSGKSSLLEALTSVQSQAEVKKYGDLPEMLDGMTVDELAVELNMSADSVRTRLKALAAQGRLVIGKKKTTDLTGRDIFVPAYKFKES